MNPIKCFMLEEIEEFRLWLRRYISSDEKCLACKHGYHDVMVLHGDVVGKIDRDPREIDALVSDDDPRWPTHCECGIPFGPEVCKQRFIRGLYKRLDTGQIMTIEDAPAGAMWNCSWLIDCPEQCGPDGLSLAVKLPNGHTWRIDGSCNNCTIPNDKIHKCWVRHGTPPIITVDKNGNTCQAGAGSIQAGDYHGFLRDGYLVEA